jgi:hypothetical protein
LVVYIHGSNGYRGSFATHRRIASEVSFKFAQKHLEKFLGIDVAATNRQSRTQCLTISIKVLCDQRKSYRKANISLELESDNRGTGHDMIESGQQQVVSVGVVTPMTRVPFAIDFLLNENVAR